MDDARKKLRICLIFVVVAAIIVGIIYYLNDGRSDKDVSDGTLVREENVYFTERNKVWQETA